MIVRVTRRNAAIGRRPNGPPRLTLSGGVSYHPLDLAGRDVPDRGIDIRPWQAGDEKAVAAGVIAEFSPQGLADRFHGGWCGSLPAEYALRIASGPGLLWDAQVALSHDHLIGWAEFGRRPGALDEAEFAVIVTDRWQRRGVARALIASLLPRATRAGVERLCAEVVTTNYAAHALVASIFGADARRLHRGYTVRYELRLTVA
jgi:GNAT superfamily N-acetyltransferase